MRTVTGYFLFGGVCLYVFQGRTINYFHESVVGLLIGVNSRLVVWAYTFLWVCVWWLLGNLVQKLSFIS